MTTRQVPVWEIFPTQVKAITDPTTLADLFALLDVTDAKWEDQLEAIFTYVDSPLYLYASVNLMNEVDEFIYDHIIIDGQVQVQAEFNDSEPRDENGKWIGGGTSFAKTQARGRLQALANQARGLAGLNTNAPVMISINKVPQGSSTPSYTGHSDAKDHGHWEDMATASDNDAVKTQGAIIYLQISGTKDNFVGWIGTGNFAPVLLAMNGVNLYDANGKPAEGAPIVQPLAPKPGGGIAKVSGPKTPKNIGDHTGNNYSVENYDPKIAEKNAMEVQTKIMAVQLQISNGVTVNAGMLKANVASTIAERMGSRYDAQIMPIVRVAGNPDSAASWQEKQYQAVSAATLMTSDDVWEQRMGGFGNEGKPQYTYIGKVGEQEQGGAPGTLNSFGVQPSNNVTITNIPGDTPDIANSLREAGVSNMVRLWAQSSNDKHELSLAIQDAAAKEFNLPDAKTWNKGGAQLKAGVAKVLEFKGEALQAFVRAQYDVTQEFFKSQSITEVQLFRGFRTSAGGLKGSVGTKVQVQMRPLSSFSLNRGTASNFAGQGSNSVMVAGVIPIENILSTSLTGVGCQSEREVVVIGGKNTYNLDKYYGSYS